jgi:hypothetical protein
MEETKQFLGAYFNQDWDMEAPTWEGIVDIFLRDEPSSSTIQAIVVTLRELADSDQPEEIVADRLLREFGSFYDPRGSGVRIRDWLLAVAERLTAPKTAK